MFDTQALRDRLIPFSSLQYSTEAFIDYRIPECSPKFNYALIGPGVSQNPNQPVSLREKHGFQPTSQARDWRQCGVHLKRWYFLGQFLSHTLD